MIKMEKVKKRNHKLTAKKSAIKSIVCDRPIITNLFSN